MDINIVINVGEDKQEVKIEKPKAKRVIKKKDGVLQFPSQGVGVLDMLGIKET